MNIPAREQNLHILNVGSYRIELYDYVIVMLYLFLIIQDFQWSEYVYDNIVEECVHWQEGRIDRTLKSISEYLDANFKDWVVTIKDFIVNTIRGVILPMIMDLIWKSKTKQLDQQLSGDSSPPLKKELSTVSEENNNNNN